MNNTDIQENLIEKDDLTVENSPELLGDQSEFESDETSFVKEDKVPSTDINLDGAEKIVEDKVGGDVRESGAGYSLDGVVVDFSPRKVSLRGGDANDWKGLYTEKQAA